MHGPDRIVRLKTVLARTALSRSTIYRKIAEGTFPAQIRISANGAGWRESDIDRWIADPVAWRPRGEFDFNDLFEPAECSGTRDAKAFSGAKAKTT